MNFRKPFSRIDNQQQAIEKAEGGLLAGLILAGLEFFGLIINWISERPLFEYESRTDYEFYCIVIFLIGLVLFLSWRVYEKKECVSSLFLLFLFILSAIFGLMTHPEMFMGVGVVVWIIIRIWLFITLINSVRGCFYLRKNKRTPV